MTMRGPNAITSRRFLSVMWVEFVLPLVLLVALLNVASRPADAQGAAQAVAGGDLVWQVIDASGDVRVRTAGTAPTPWRKLAAGETVSANAELEAGSDGKAVLAHDGSRIVISSNSQLTLPDRVPNGAVYRVVQHTGTMLFKIIHSTKDKFQVQTPYLTTVIKGTTFSVSVNGAGGSVHVTEGAVLVQPLVGTAALVSPGQTARVPAGSSGGVMINGRNGNGGGNRPAAPAADTVQKSNETGSPQAVGGGHERPVGSRTVTIVFDNDVGKSGNNRGLNDNGSGRAGEGNRWGASGGSNPTGKADSSQGNSSQGGRSAQTGGGGVVGVGISNAGGGAIGGGSSNAGGGGAIGGGSSNAGGSGGFGGGSSNAGGGGGFGGGSSNAGGGGGFGSGSSNAGGGGGFGGGSSNAGGGGFGGGSSNAGGGGALGATPAALSGSNSGNGNAPGLSEGALDGNGNPGNGIVKGKKK